MKEYIIKKYEKTDYNAWNTFISEAKNATFLFHRDFMEYHADRFEDYSLIVLENKKWVAVLPANIVDNEIYSHQGLTYGGLLINENNGIECLENMFDVLLNYLKLKKIINLYIKPVLSIYSESPSNELDYLLFKKNALLLKRELNMTVDLSKKISVNKNKIKKFNKISSDSYQLINEPDFESFWNEVLTPKLNEKYNTKPLHSLEEIRFLKTKFPENIQQFNCYQNNQIIAGITLFIDKKTIKSQYGAANKMGETLRALDFLFLSLFEIYKHTHTFFDMGTVTIVNENNYNSGLLKQKEELGCKAYCQDTYKLKII